MRKTTLILAALAVSAFAFSSGCKKKASAATSSTGSSAQASTSGGDTGIPECDKYIAGFQKYMKCDKIPASAKAATKQSVETMKKGWAALKGPNVPASAKQAAAKGCTTALDALKKSASALHCDI